ncbi:CRISPR-associated helicase Cas3' [Microbispora sp. H10885]|uniref:CRISPR-associated helicase Cas3' n=1 Tax=Microbispora sp. H10885 TaxID=2729110 RepID=UPI0015FF88E5|nr:CRISPR-associated helicase Cas3' [Microbispora sp. H10885]
MNLWAHSSSKDGVRHGLEDHLRSTAALAGDFAGVFGAGELAAYLGLVHDVGKGSCSWQEGLIAAEPTKSRVVDAQGQSIDHKAAGTWLAVREAGLGLFGMPVLGHHGGLPDIQDLKRCIALAETDDRERVQEAIERVSKVIPEIASGPFPELPAWVKSAPDPLAVELLIRMVFSALVDADFLDTSRHFSGAPRPEPASLATMADAFEGARIEYLAEAKARTGSSPVDGIRAEVYDQAVSAAAQPPGIFPFPAPTGSGKTIAAGGFAVHHAARHRLRRVIIAVPYMSITEQNAKVYRRLFGEANVLEHHSSVDLHRLPAGRRWQRLAAENWDAPVVVTTTVQLFQSLFDRRPSAMRKVHRLAGSVIVLDEVQSLPDSMLLPILSALRQLTEYFGTSVLLASATQPAFFDLGIFRGLKPTEVIAQPQPLYERLRRVRYIWRCHPKPTFKQIAAEAAGERQVLLIVNTTGDAAQLHEQLIKLWKHDGPVLHLSTRMTAGHRREVLDDIYELVGQNQPVAVVATQLVEAGVDLDFPVVYRALAPAEALQQAAGRANRNGTLAEGRVIVFDPADGNTWGTRLVYGAALDTSKRFIGPNAADPDDLAALRAYYRARYAVKNVEGSGAGRQIQDRRADFDFPVVAERFKMIEERTVPILVHRGEDRKLHALRARLRSSERIEPWVFRDIQPYLATLPVNLARQAAEQGKAAELIGDLYEWLGDYDTHRGIQFPSPDTEDKDKDQ